MRLIDADEIIKTFEKQKQYAKEDIVWCIDRAIENVHEQPTAYDVEKVVKELYHSKRDYHGDGMWVIDVLNYWEAIDIVKRGGINVRPYLANENI